MESNVVKYRAEFKESIIVFQMMRQQNNNNLTNKQTQCFIGKLDSIYPHCIHPASMNVDDDKKFCSISDEAAKLGLDDYDDLRKSAVDAANRDRIMNEFNQEPTAFLTSLKAKYGGINGAQEKQI